MLKTSVVKGQTRGGKRGQGSQGSAGDGTYGRKRAEKCHGR